MKNSNENLKLGSWLLTFLQHQKRSILLPKSQIFLRKGGSSPLATPDWENFLKI